MSARYLRPIIFTGLFAIPFIPFLVSSYFFFPFITTKAFAFRIIVEVIFAAWLVLALLDSSYRPKKSLILYAIGIFILIVGVADLLGIAPVKSFWSNFERMEGFLAILHLGMFFAVISSVFNESLWKKWWNASLTASFLMFLYSLMQLAGLKAINQGGVRIDGTLGNAIYLAVYALFHIFVALLFMVREWKNTASRWIYGVLILSNALVLYYTATRGTILGLLGGLLIIAVLNIRNRESVFARKASIIILSTLVLLVGGFSLVRNTAMVRESPTLSRFTSLTSESVKTQGRYFVWPMALKGIKERPILGWGQENFPYVFQEHYRPEMFSLEPWFDRAHNVFLDWGIAGGILGLLSYLSLYGALLYLLWKSSLPNIEKSILVGLVAAYAFHNFFVFDNLISYILFFSVLAYVHVKNIGEPLWQKNFNDNQVKKILFPAVSILALIPLYFVNIKPMMSNLFLIESLKALQTPSGESNSAKSLQKAYGVSRLGRPEVVERIISNSVRILSSNMPTAEKNQYFVFAKSAVIKLVENKEFEKEARYQLAVGGFITNFGFFDEALAHLERARQLMPNKPSVYFEIGAAYIGKEDAKKALEAFKHAYELAPDYTEAKIIYLIGAIYARDRNLENKLISELPSELISKDPRVAAAYKAIGR
ncbi:MAG: O-antigen ligase family protein [Candidatus Zambryskibacteria bacterium]|nr:O-antigen ligase family protein [Candidatus Zambryskibacteria bacterium]